MRRHGQGTVARSLERGMEAWEAWEAWEAGIKT